MPMTTDATPIAKWLDPGVRPDEGLAGFGDLLQYAAGHYRHHTDTFVRHKEFGFKALAAALTAEFAIVGYSLQGNVPWWLAVPGLGTIGVIVVVLTALSIRTCSQAYTAALEHAALVAKIIWVYSFGDKVRRAATMSDPDHAPLPGDETFFAPRFMGDARSAPETADFVTTTFGRRWTTLKTTKWTLRTVCGGAAAFATVASFALYFR